MVFSDACTKISVVLKHNRDTFSGHFHSVFAVVKFHSVFVPETLPLQKMRKSVLRKRDPIFGMWVFLAPKCRPASKNQKTLQSNARFSWETKPKKSALGPQNQMPETKTFEKWKNQNLSLCHQNKGNRSIQSRNDFQTKIERLSKRGNTGNFPLKGWHANITTQRIRKPANCLFQTGRGFTI